MKKVWYVLSMALILLIASCQSDNPSMITLGLDDTYVVERMKGLTLHPGFTGERYEWALSYESDSVSVTDSIVATTRDYTFVASETGTYRLRFQIYDAANPITHLMRIVVRKEEVAYSPYITKVYEYRPAPGQFVNELPRYTEGDTEESMRQKVEDCLAYDARTMVSLGGYGGYIVVGFDHTIVNRPGEYDFKILGNAFYANDNPRPDAPLGGSSEPGIVMVSVDTNGNGVPDDEWYELAGSEYYKKETLKNYEITYDQWGCMAKGGFAGEGTPYLGAYWDAYTESTSDTKPCEVYTSAPYYAVGCYVCNNPYVYYAIEKGNPYSTKFEQGDWFKLVAHGIDEQGTETGTVEYYLADYRSENADDWKLNDTWEWVDLSELGQIASI